MDIEKEIQARVNFKINELLTTVENSAKINWNIAFRSNSQKHSHYWEAFGQLKNMIKKECDMSVPYDDMVEQNRRKSRDLAVNNISERLLKRGDRDYYQKLSLIVSEIEKSQNY